MDIQELSDRQEIVDLITRYTRAIDTGDYGDLVNVFASDAVLDYTSVGGPRDVRDEVMGWLAQGLAGFARVQHLIGQVSITLAGTGPDRTALATAYFYNPMVVVAPDGTESVVEVGGYYHHTLAWTTHGWRSVELVDETTWHKGF